MKKILKLGARLSVIDGGDVEIMDALPPAVYSMNASRYARGDRLSLML
jgi:hypothetical protein